MRPQTADGRAPGNNETTLAGGEKRPQHSAAESCQGCGGKGAFSNWIRRAAATEPGFNNKILSNCDVFKIFRFWLKSIRRKPRACQATRPEWHLYHCCKLFCGQNWLKKWHSASSNQSGFKLTPVPLVYQPSPKHLLPWTGNTNAMNWKEMELFRKDKGRPIRTLVKSTNFIKGLSFVEDFLFYKIEKLPIFA